MELDTIVCGDCLYVMRDMPDGCVDLVVTDPPLGVRDDDWDRMNNYELARLTMSWVSAARRISERLLVFSNQPHLQLLSGICEKLYVESRLLIWDKPMGSQYVGSSHNGLWYSFDPILYCHPGHDKPKSLMVGRLIKEARRRKDLSRGAVDMIIRGKKTGLCYRWEEAACLPTDEQAEMLCALLGLGNTFLQAILDSRIVSQKASGKDVFSYRTVTNGRHPCEKPEELINELINIFTDSEQVVFDPFIGSGTTAVAALKLGRHFYGCDTNPKYIELANRRIEKARLEMAQMEMDLTNSTKRDMIISNPRPTPGCHK